MYYVVLLYMVQWNNLDIFARYLNGLFFSISDTNTSDLIYVEVVAGGPYIPYF